MPSAETVLNLVYRARDAFRSQLGRHGYLVTIPENCEVLIAGDLHGNLENFRLLLKKADLANHPQRHFVLQELIHGPFEYPLGGDKSHQLLDLTAALKCQFPEQVHFLPGNHELAQWIDRPVHKEGVDQVENFAKGAQLAYAEKADDVLRAYQQLFAALPLAIRTSNRVFMSHSYPSSLKMDFFDPSVFDQDKLRDEQLQPGGDVFALVWGRDYDEETVTRYLKMVDADFVITGHEPCEEGFEAPNSRQLILDSLGYPAAYCLFPTNPVLSLETLLEHVHLL